MALATPAAEAYQATSAVSTPTHPPTMTSPSPAAWPAKNPRNSRISVTSKVRNTRNTARLTAMLHSSM